MLYNRYPPGVESHGANCSHFKRSKSADRSGEGVSQSQMGPRGPSVPLDQVDCRHPQQSRNTAESLVRWQQDHRRSEHQVRCRGHQLVGRPLRLRLEAPPQVRRARVLSSSLSPAPKDPRYYCGSVVFLAQIFLYWHSSYSLLHSSCFFIICTLPNYHQFPPQLLLGHTF